MKLISITLALIFAVTPAYGHSGGTDSSGCHNSSTGRHCHSGGSDGAGLAALGDVLIVTGVVFSVWGIIMLVSDSSSGSLDEDATIELNEEDAKAGVLFRF